MQPQFVVFTISKGTKYYIRDTGTHYQCSTDITKATKMSASQAWNCAMHIDNVTVEEYVYEFSV